MQKQLVERIIDVRGGSKGAALIKVTRQILAIILNITLKEKFVITRMK